METLVVVGHHRNHQQYHGRNRGHGSTRFGSFGSPSSGSFRGINCRTFQSGEGLISNPFKSCSTTTPVSKKALSSSFSPKTPFPSVNETLKNSKRISKSSSIPISIDIEFGTLSPSLSENTKNPKGIAKSSSNPIPIDVKFGTLSPSLSEITKNSSRIEKSSPVPIPFNLNFENKEAEFHFSELWAGPAYSNSPPPSSLPIPKFSLRPKRTVSLELPTVSSEIDLHLISKSAPASPTRSRSPSPSDLFDTADSATKTLRRMLNLDITDE